MFMAAVLEDLSPAEAAAGRRSPRATALLERDAPMALLEQLFGRMRQGHGGACVLVHGEAGIGKTSLVQAFVQRLDPAAMQPLVAGCEALYSPRPLGPLVDLADRFAPSVAAALHAGGSWNGLFPAL